MSDSMGRETKVVTGSFLARRDAQHAVQRLVAAGFRRDALSVLASEPVRDDELAGVPQSTAPEPDRVAQSACAGGTLGGALGAVVAGLAAVGSIAVPELGVVISGAIVAALAGAGAGGATGGLAGALIGLGIGEAERRDAGRATGWRDARIVVAVETVRERARSAVEILRAEGSLEIGVG